MNLLEQKWIKKNNVMNDKFIDASRLVYDGIRDIRKAVLMIRVSCAGFSTSATKELHVQVTLSTFSTSEYGQSK